MDNRLIFLYCIMTELWGRMCKAWAGTGKTGASAGGIGEANPPVKPVALSGAKRSSEARGACAEKSRYCSCCTRTVNRHRWMRRRS